MLRRIRKVACVLAAVPPLALIPMWMRSYHRGDEMCIGLWGDRAAIVASKQGRVIAVWINSTPVMQPKRWTFTTHSHDDGTSFPVGQMRDYEWKLGFGWIVRPDYLLDFNVPPGGKLVWSGPKGAMGSVTEMKADGSSGAVHSWGRSTSGDSGGAVSYLGASSSTFSYTGHFIACLTAYGPIVPYWFLILTTGIALAFTWPRNSWQFSLRALFVTVAYVSILLALVRALDS